MHGHDPADPATWGFVLALATLLTSAHFLMMALVANRWTLKPVLAVLIVATALATYFMARYSVYFDATMVRNVLRTDVGEARELLSPALLPHLLLYAVLPLVLLAAAVAAALAAPAQTPLPEKPAPAAAPDGKGRAKKPRAPRKAPAKSGAKNAATRKA